MLGLFAPAEGVVTFSFKAVKKGANVISPPVSTLPAMPGDTIEVNVFASGWNAPVAGALLRTYQFEVDARKGYYNNGGPGFILPKGWNAIRDLIMCDSPADCPDNQPRCTEDGFCKLFCDEGPGVNAACLALDPAYPTCSAQRENSCVGPGHMPEMGAFITEGRADYVFAPPIVGFSAVDTRDLDYGYGATVIGGPVEGAADMGGEKYLGTLIIVIQPGACGTYKVGAKEIIARTLVELVVGGDLQAVLPDISELTITLPGNCGACCDPETGDCSVTTEPVCIGDGGTFIGPGSVCGLNTCVLCPTLSSNPPNCVIDARLPNLTTSAARLGFTSVDITFSDTPPVPPTVGTFTVSVTPDQAGANPVITGVMAQQSPPNTFRLTLNPPVPPRAWSCFTYNGCAPGPKICLGALPMDADQSRLSALADLTVLINALNDGQAGSNPANLHKFDMDRSGSFTTVDLVTWVDMAVGATTFLPVLLEREIPIACPSAMP